MSHLRQTLSDLHEELAHAHQLGPEDRALLQAAIVDIREALMTSPDASASALEDGSAPAPGQHGDTLEGAAVRLEAGHPGVAGAIRAVLDALGKAGI